MNEAVWYGGLDWIEGSDEEAIPLADPFELGPWYIFCSFRNELGIYYLRDL